MASPATYLKGLKPKHYILAVLLATLAAAVFVTVFFVLLSPARIYFSVINPSSQEARDGGVDLYLTLAANNTSQRAWVRYQTILVDLTNNTGPASTDTSAVWTSVFITNTEAISGWHPQGSVVTVNATVSVPLDPQTKSFITSDDLRNSTFTIKVTAVARFKVSIARTRLYDIDVVCSPVRFLVQKRRQNGRGGSAAASSAVPPVDCMPY